jgi:hypothetical protein
MPLKGVFKSTRKKKTIKNLKYATELENSIKNLQNKINTTQNYKQLHKLKQKLQLKLKEAYSMTTKTQSDDAFFCINVEEDRCRRYMLEVCISEGIHVFLNKEEASYLSEKLPIMRGVYKRTIIEVQCNTNDLVASNETEAVFTKITIP